VEGYFGVELERWVGIGYDWVWKASIAICVMLRVMRGGAGLDL